MSGQTSPDRNHRSAKIRFLLFLALLGGTFIAFWLLRLDSYFTNSGISSVIDSIRSFEARLGVLGPLLHWLAGSLVIILNLPTIFIIWLSVVLYGPVVGGIMGFLCLHTSSSLMFQLSNALGRDFTNRLMKRRLSAIRSRFADNGFKTVLYIRLFFFMMPPVNWFVGLIDVSFKDHFTGTLLGTLHTILIHIWFAGVGIALLENDQSLWFWNSSELAAPIVVALVIILIVKIVDRWFMRLDVLAVEQPVEGTPSEAVVEIELEETV